MVWFTGNFYYPMLQLLSDDYCDQLDNVAAALNAKLDRIYFLYDDARPRGEDNSSKTLKLKVECSGAPTLSRLSSIKLLLVPILGTLFE